MLQWILPLGLLVFVWIFVVRRMAGGGAAGALNLGRKGVKALEAYGDVQGEVGACILPADFLAAVGFKTIARHPRYPLLRMELRTVLRWRGDVEVALERWLGAIRPEKAAGPIGASPRTRPRTGETG